MTTSNRLNKMLNMFSRPFERSAFENDQIYSAAKSFDVLSGQVAPNVLKELCVVAQLDVWKEEDLTSKEGFLKRGGGIVLSKWSLYFNSKHHSIILFCSSFWKHRFPLHLKRHGETSFRSLGEVSRWRSRVSIADTRTSDILRRGKKRQIINISISL